MAIFIFTVAHRSAGDLTADTAEGVDVRMAVSIAINGEFQFIHRAALVLASNGA